MIDVENLVFNAIYEDIAPLCAPNGFKSVYVPSPTAFPTVALFEMDNRTDRERRSTGEDEDYAILTYEAHVFAQTKAECRNVFMALDDVLTRRNFNRLSGAYTPNLQNDRVHEYVARYRVRVSNDGCLSRVS